MRTEIAKPPTNAQACSVSRNCAATVRRASSTGFMLQPLDHPSNAVAVLGAGTGPQPFEIEPSQLALRSVRIFAPQLHLLHADAEFKKLECRLEPLGGSR